MLWIRDTKFGGLPVLPEPRCLQAVSFPRGASYTRGACAVVASPFPLQIQEGLPELLLLATGHQKSTLVPFITVLFPGYCCCSTLGAVCPG